jgi:hypothetical protein
MFETEAPIVGMVSYHKPSGSYFFREMTPWTLLAHPHFSRMPPTTSCMSMPLLLSIHAAMK